MPDILDQLEAELTHHLPVEHHRTVYAAIDHIRDQLGGSPQYIATESRGRRDAQISKAVESGKTMTEVAKEHGVNKSTVSRIMRKRSGYL